MGRKIRLRVNTAMLGHAAGSVVEIDAKEDGSPAELFWRRRLRDATRADGDGCVTVLPDLARSGTLPESEAETASGSD